METPFNKSNNRWLRIRQDDVATTNNALTIVSGYAQLLLKETYVRPEDRKKLEEIVKQVERIARILRQAKSQDCKESPREILKDLQEIREVLK